MFCTGFVLSGTKLLNRGNNNPMVLSGLSLSGTTEGVFSFSPTVGRYVNIRQVARYRRLVLCEVEVFGVYAGDFRHTVQSTRVAL